MKKKANFIKFWAAYRRCEDSGGKLILEACQRQYKLLCEGIRDVRIGDTACHAWTDGGGEW